MSVNVRISGDDLQANTLVANVVGEALQDAGFSSVSLVNQADEIKDITDSTTMLDLVQQTRPDLFAVPVNIQATMEMEDVQPEEQPEETQVA